MANYEGRQFTLQENDREELITFKAIRSKDDCEYPITFPIDGTIAQLKEHIHSLLGIPEKNIKLGYSGGYQFNLLMNDDLSLREADVQTGVKIMIIEETEMVDRVKLVS